MNMEHARKMLREAMQNGLNLHGLSTNGKPAISFDMSHPRAHIARAQFQSCEGLVRELLRAAMIEECQRQGLPDELPPPMEYAAMARRSEERPKLLH